MLGQRAVGMRALKAAFAGAGIANLVLCGVFALVAIREQSQTMEVAASTGAAFNLSEGDRPERVGGRRLSSNFFRVLGVQPALGRGFTIDEETVGQHHVAVISDGLWDRRFGGDPSILGTTILLDGEPHTVIGVMPAGFWFGNVDDGVWVPLAISGEENRNSHYLWTLTRLKPGNSMAQAISSRKSTAIASARLRCARHWALADTASRVSSSQRR